MSLFFSIVLLCSDFGASPYGLFRLDGSGRAYTLASSAVNAGICINLCLGIPHCNSSYRALRLACSTQYAIITNYMSHCTILLIDRSSCLSRLIPYDTKSDIRIQGGIRREALKYADVFKIEHPRQKRTSGCQFLQSIGIRVILFMFKLREEVYLCLNF